MRYIKEERTKRERKMIYKILRRYGISVSNAQRMRDWSLGHIERYLLNFFDIDKVEEIMHQIRQEVRK